jgi:hypothetical protein
VGCDLVSPFRVFGFAAGSTAFRPQIILFGLAARSATSSATVSRYWFSDPTLPLAVASAVWFFRSGCSWLRLSMPTCIRSRVYLPQSIHPANPSRRAAAHQLLSWAFIPYSTSRDGRSTFRGLCLAHCVPPSGFGYPRDGLRPSRPWPVLFRTGSAHGIHPSELPPLKRYSTRFRAGQPTYCFTRLYTLCRGIGPAGRPQFLGISPFQSPWRLTCV